MLLKQHFFARVERVPFSCILAKKRTIFKEVVLTGCFHLELRDLFLESPGLKAIFSNQNLKYREAGLGP